MASTVQIPTPKKVIIPPLKVDGSRYLDGSRFPKVVTEGYEKKFKEEYVKSMNNMLLDLVEKIKGFNQ